MAFLVFPKMHVLEQNKMHKPYELLAPQLELKTLEINHIYVYKVIKLKLCFT